MTRALIFIAAMAMAAVASVQSVDFNPPGGPIPGRRAYDLMQASDRRPYQSNNFRRSWPDLYLKSRTADAYADQADSDSAYRSNLADSDSSYRRSQSDSDSDSSYRRSQWDSDSDSSYRSSQSDSDSDSSYRSYQADSDSDSASRRSSSSSSSSSWNSRDKREVEFNSLYPGEARGF